MQVAAPDPRKSSMSSHCGGLAAGSPRAKSHFSVKCPPGCLLLVASTSGSCPNGHETPALRAEDELQRPGPSHGPTAASPYRQHTSPPISIGRPTSAQTRVRGQDSYSRDGRQLGIAGARGGLDHGNSRSKFSSQRNHISRAAGGSGPIGQTEPAPLRRRLREETGRCLGALRGRYGPGGGPSR